MMTRSENVNLENSIKDASNIEVKFKSESIEGIQFFGSETGGKRCEELVKVKNGLIYFICFYCKYRN